MSLSAIVGGMAETERTIFPQYGYWPVSMDEAVTAARRAGYRSTQHGTYQRGLWHAVRLVPNGAGVDVSRAWTTAQIIGLGVFFTLLVIFVCSGA